MIAQQDTADVTHFRRFFMSMSSTPTSMPQNPIPHANASSLRWKVLAAGTLANVAFSIVVNGFPMTAIQLRTGYGLDAWSLGLMLGMMGLGVAISELPWGMLADHWGDRPVLLLGLGGSALVLACMTVWGAPHSGHTPGLALVYAGLLVTGLLGGSVNGASGRAIMHWFAPGERGLAMSIRQTAVPMGGALGALLLPRIAASAGFDAMFAFLAVICVLCAGLVWLWIINPPDADTPTAAQDHPRSPSALKNTLVWQIACGIAILCAPQFAVLSFGTVFLHDAAQVSSAAITTAMVTLQVGAMVLRIWSGRWTDRHGNRIGFLRWCAALSALSFVALAAAQAVHLPGVMLAVMLAVSGVCVSAWHGVAYAELATQAGATQAGTALGLCNTLVFVANFLVPQAVVKVQERIDWSGVWLLCGGVALLALPLVSAHLRVKNRLVA